MRLFPVGNVAKYPARPSVPVCQRAVLQLSKENILTRAQARRQGWKGGWLPFLFLELQRGKGSIQFHRMLKDMTNFESHESCDGSQAGGELLQFKLELCSSASRDEA